MNGKNIRISFIIISIIFGIMPTVLCNKMVVNAQTFNKSDISYTEEVVYANTSIVVDRDEIAGRWGFYDKTGYFNYFDSVSNGTDTTYLDSQTYIHFRCASYTEGVLTGYYHYIYLFPSNQGYIESVTIPENGQPFYGMSGMYTVTPLCYYIYTDAEENVTNAKRDKYFNGRLTYPYNTNLIGSNQTWIEKDIRTLVLGHGGTFLDVDGNDFFRVTPQGTIATVIQKNQIQLNPLQEIMKVLPMVILFLVGYLGLWKALEIFRRLLHKESII